MEGDVRLIGTVTDAYGDKISVGADHGLMTLSMPGRAVAAWLDAAQRGRLSALIAEAEAACLRYRGGDSHE